MPTHCHRSGRSLRNRTAMVMVQKGLLARIGAAMDIGRCLSAKDAKIHELPAIRFQEQQEVTCCCQRFNAEETSRDSIREELREQDQWKPQSSSRQDVKEQHGRYRILFQRSLLRDLIESQKHGRAYAEQHPCHFERSTRGCSEAKTSRRPSVA